MLTNQTQPTTGDEREDLIDNLHGVLGHLGFSRETISSALTRADAVMEEISAAIDAGGDPAEVLQAATAKIRNEGATPPASPFVRFPHRSGDEMKTLFEAPFMAMVNEHGIMLLADDEFNQALDFALLDAADGADFVSILEELYFSKQDDDSATVGFTPEDITGLTDSYLGDDVVFKSIRGLSDLADLEDTFVLHDAEQEARDKLAELGIHVSGPNNYAAEMEQRIYPYQQEAIDQIQRWIDGNSLDADDDSLGFEDTIMADENAGEAIFGGEEDVAEDDEEDHIKIVMGGINNSRDLTPALRELHRILESAPEGDIEIVAIIKPTMEMTLADVTDMIDELG